VFICVHPWLKRFVLAAFRRQTSIIVIVFGLFWPVATSPNDDKQILTIASIHNGIGLFVTSLSFPCLSLP
jgi:hypothetical protein